MIQAFEFWIKSISTIVEWIFKIEIIEEPSISLGMFLLGFAFIGLILYFILGTDFFPGHINANSSSGVNYTPKHSPGNTYKYNSNSSTRIGRHNNNRLG